MEFDLLDKQMREFEQSLDRTMPDDIYLVARLDGHGFTRLTKTDWDLKKPFDERFKDVMCITLRRLMECNFKVVFGYTQSDEISLLFHCDDKIFGRKERKLLSILASEASVAFSMAAGRRGVFDCRLVPLPSADNVIDYFRWRQEDCLRNALEAHCYWLLRGNGLTPSDANRTIAGMSNENKKRLLEENGVYFDDMPLWQRRGIGMYFCQREQPGYNPKTGAVTTCMRRILVTDQQLPTGSEYSEMIESFL